MAAVHVFVNVRQHRHLCAEGVMRRRVSGGAEEGGEGEGGQEEEGAREEEEGGGGASVGHRRRGREHLLGYIIHHRNGTGVEIVK